MGIPPTGKKAEMSGMTMDRLKEGKIVEAWWNADDFGMMQQLGIIPPME
jgi:predicted ester cyclase